LYLVLLIHLMEQWYVTMHVEMHKSAILSPTIFEANVYIINRYHINISIEILKFYMVIKFLDGLVVAIPYVNSEISI